MQAAQKLVKESKELKALRAERDEAARARHDNASADEGQVRRLGEMEAALRKATQHVDRANATVKRLEKENAEVRGKADGTVLFFYRSKL